MKRKISRARIERDLKESGSTADFEKKENMFPLEVYQEEEKIEAEKEHDSRSGTGEIKTLVMMAEIEETEVIEIPADKAEFSFFLDKDEYEGEETDEIDEGEEDDDELE